MEANLNRPINLLTLLFCASLLTGLLACGGCGGDDKSTGGNTSTDRTPPTVVGTVPDDGDSTVSQKIEIVATLSEPIDLTSLGAGAITLDPSVAGSISYSSRDLTISLDPSSDLDSNTTYTATVNTSIADTAGNHLASAYSWTFSTFKDHTPPTVTEVLPVDNDSTVIATASVQVTFSEKMDLSTINSGSFYLTPSVPATVTPSYTGAILQPSAELDTFQLYTATLTTAITDSAGNPLASDYTWSFYTIPDLVPPTAGLDLPFDNAVVPDNVAIIVTAADNDAIERVEYYIDNALVSGATDYAAPYEYIYDASAWDTASVHTVFARAYDNRGNTADTDTATVHFHWRLLTTDPNEYDILRNVEAVYERSTPTQIQFRVKTYNGWGHYSDAVGGIDCAFYIDIDQNQATGDTETSGHEIGDIGAEYLMIIGYHGDVLNVYSSGAWNSAGSPASLKIQDNTNIFEVSINRSQLNYDALFDMVVVNVNIDDPNNYLYDWVPDTGHRTVTVDGTYSSASSSSAQSPAARTERSSDPTPFD